MSWLSLYVAALIAATIVSLVVAFVVAGRLAVPGRVWLVALSISVAWWCVTSAIQVTIDDVGTRVAWAKAQYVAVVACSPLFFLFTHDYTGGTWWRTRARRALLVVIPLVTLSLAFTNELHGWVWRSITPTPHGNVYGHGVWFWILAAQSYVLLGAGTAVIVRSVLGASRHHRGQALPFIVGALAPWIANVLYLAGVRPGQAIDLTPLGFSLTALCLAWSMRRHRFLDLVPIARERVFDSMTEAVVVIDPRQRVIDMNAAARTTIGGQGEWLGRPVEELLPWWPGRLERGTETARSVFVSLRSDDHHLEVDVSPIHDGRSVAGWLVLMRDVSARVAGDRERLALDRRLLEQQKLESLRVVAAGISHDFNNLLATIVGNADLVTMHLPPDPNLRQLMETIVSGAQRAADLVEQMLAYAGEGRGVSQSIDLEALTRETVQLVEGSIARGLTIEYEAASGLPPMHGDPLQMGQVVLNLLINAVEAATPTRARIAVAVGCEVLTRAAIAEATFGGDAPPGPYLFVEVRDEGPGMHEATLGRIFDPFFTTKESGHGLGLAAVQGIVRSHGGVVRVVSAPGCGSTFRVWLPLQRVPAPGAAAPDGATETAGEMSPEPGAEAR